MFGIICCTHRSFPGCIDEIALKRLCDDVKQCRRCSQDESVLHRIIVTTKKEVKKQHDLNEENCFYDKIITKYESDKNDRLQQRVIQY
jgi:hypothetical protein